jgi:hypothetical protein
MFFLKAEPPCYIVYNTSAEYPACCGKVVCDPVEGNEIDVGKCSAQEFKFFTQFPMKWNSIRDL